MAKLIKERMTIANEQELVVFLIGMRVNAMWKVHKWTPIAAAMTRMLKELNTHPEMGFLGAESTLNFPTTLMVQYWRSFEDLEAYARAHDQSHWPAWVAFNKRVGRSRGDVGIWHETYRVAASQYEAIYSGMPAFGLGNVGRLVPVSAKRDSARERIEATV